jgi:Zn-dependent peptidase ImmA (M78 family)
MGRSDGTLLRRGFKAWCENAAWGFRRDLGLDKAARLDPRHLARHVGVAIWTPHEIQGLDPVVLNYLLKVDSASWSAVTLTVGRASVIIINSSHAASRQNNSLAHELSHLILKHEPAKAFVTPDGMMMMNHYNPTHEEEASCLSSTLLVPREGLLRLLSLGHNDEQMASHFAVSLDLLRMRKNITGVARQLRYFRRGARRRS